MLVSSISKKKDLLNILIGLKRFKTSNSDINNHLMSYMKKFLLLLMLAIISLYSYAEGEVAVGDFVYSLNTENKTACLVKSNFKDYHCIIPESFTYDNQQYSVTSIGQGAFKEAKIISVTIPNTVTKIGEKAFMSCYILVTVDIPNSVTEIGDEAFRDCESLTGIVFPKRLKSINYRLCYGCIRLNNVTIPNGLESIGKQAFVGCGYLVLRVPSSVKSIGENAFAGGFTARNKLTNGTSLDLTSYGLTVYDKITDNGLCIHNNVIVGYVGKSPSVVIPEGVVGIDDDVFAYSYIKSITIPQSVKSIGKRAFYNSSISSIELPNDLACISDSAFCGCTVISSIRIPHLVTEIGDGAFDGCQNLETVIMPEGLKSIGCRAFSGCVKIASVKIPSTVTNIGNNAFRLCI